MTTTATLAQFCTKFMGFYVIFDITGYNSL